MGHRLVRAVLGVILSSFYRRSALLGRDRVPERAPLVVSANHQGALVDPMLLISSFPRPLRPLAKAPLFRNPVLRPFLAALGALPVYRPQDRHLVQGSNRGLLAACSDALVQGQCLLIFPEGRSSPEPWLGPLKPGAARILLDAEAAAGHALGARLLPVAIHLEAQARFRRGRVLAQVLEPIAADDLLELHRRDPDEAVRQLTTRLEQRLRQGLVETETQEEMRLLKVALRAWAAERGERLDAEAELDLARGFARGRRLALRRRPEALARLRAEVEAWDRLLAQFELAGDDVDRRYSVVGVAGWLMRQLGALLVGAPLGLLGAALNWLPYRVTGIVAARLSDEEDAWASVKLAAAVALFPLAWLATAAAAALAVGPWAGLAALVLGPLGGMWALRFRDRQDRAAAQLRAFLLLAGGGGLSRHLRTKRRAVHDAVEALRAEVDGDGDDG